MTRVLYIPSYSERVALTKLQIVGKEVPYYWREPEAAHDMAARHYPGGKVYAVSLAADGRMLAREHVLGAPEPEAVAGIVDAIGSALTAFLIVVGGCWAVAYATLL